MPIFKAIKIINFPIELFSQYHNKIIGIEVVCDLTTDAYIFVFWRIRFCRIKAQQGIFEHNMNYGEFDFKWKIKILENIISYIILTMTRIPSHQKFENSIIVN